MNFTVTYQIYEKCEATVAHGSKTRQFEAQDVPTLMMKVNVYITTTLVMEGKTPMALLNSEGK